MKIIVMVESPPTLLLEFDPAEIEHELFETAKTEITKNPFEETGFTRNTKIEIMNENIKETKYTDAEIGFIEPMTPKKGEKIIEPLPIEPIIIDPEPSTITITGEIVENEPPMTTLGRTIDSIREKYCGDVIPLESEIDKKTGETIYKEKDLTNCPQFKIGSMETIDAAKAEEEQLQQQIEINEIEQEELIK